MDPSYGKKHIYNFNDFIIKLTDASDQTWGLRLPSAMRGARHCHLGVGGDSLACRRPCYRLLHCTFDDFVITVSVTTRALLGLVKVALSTTLLSSSLARWLGLRACDHSSCHAGRREGGARSRSKWDLFEKKWPRHCSHRRFWAQMWLW